MTSQHNYKLTIAYDGTHYGGWQVQPNAVTIQDLLQKAIGTILQKPTAVTGAGRTDAGVHAHGQVAHFKSDRSFDFFRFLGSINGILPPDIRVFTIEEVRQDFHARYSAQKKIYHYHVCLKRFHNPFLHHYSLHVREKLNKEQLKRAAQSLLGTHNFCSFANEATTGSAARNPIRTLNRIDLIEEENGFRLEFEGESFLYKMVRNLVGLLLEIATGKRPVEEIEEILAAQDRRRAGKTAPAHGLFLHEVIY